jgi:hypothetical protein
MIQHIFTGNSNQIKSAIWTHQLEMQRLHNISSLEIHITQSRKGSVVQLSNSDYSESTTCTTRNTVIGCALSKVVLRESHLKHYQQWLILSCPFQLLEVGLSEAVLYVEPLLIILSIINSGSCSKPLLICELSKAVQNMNHCR